MCAVPYGTKFVIWENSLALRQNQDRQQSLTGQAICEGGGPRRKLPFSHSLRSFYIMPVYDVFIIYWAIAPYIISMVYISF